MNFDLEEFVDLVRRANDQHHFEGKDGREYCVDNAGNVELLDHDPIETPLKLSQLTSLVDWFKRDGDPEQMLIHVVSPTRVEVVGNLDYQGKRPVYVQVNAIVPKIEYGDFYGQEAMIIMLQSKFEYTKDRDLLLKVIGNLREEKVNQQTDDGVSQSVQINSGVASVSEVKVPNPVVLSPYRTFQEISQPASTFIFRMREGMRSALFEADNAAWQVDAKQYIKEYLQKNIGDKKVTVLA